MEATQNLENFYNYLDKSKLKKEPYQKEGVMWCLKKEIEGNVVDGKIIRGGLLADEMGLGKTIQMIGVILCNFKKRTLIVLPRALLEQWVKIFKNTLGHTPVVFHGMGKKDEDKLKNAPIVITTYGMISIRGEDKVTGILHTIEWERIIFDEAHHMRNIETRIHKGAQKLSANIRWLVTGTPIQNRISDLYSLCAIMKLPDKYYINPTNLLLFVKNFILRRTKKQINLEIPDVHIHHMEISWTNKHEQNLAEDIHSLLEFSKINKSKLDNSGAISVLHPGGILPLLIRARQMCVYPPLIQDKINLFIDQGLIEDTAECREALLCSSKIDTVVSTIIERRDNKKSKLVFCHYRGEIDILEKDLVRNGINVEKFDGRTKLKERNKILENKCDVLLLQIQTGCEGLNLQHFSEIYFISPHWNPAIEDQAVARCHRIGQKESIDIFRFKMKAFDNNVESCTLDVHSSNVQKNKRTIMNMIN